MKDKHNLLGIVLPTNSPDVMRKYLLSSLEIAKDAAPFCTFLINFQPPYTANELSEVVETIKSYGFKVKTNYNVYRHEPGLVPVNRIREDTAAIDSSCKYYMIFDDDMTFMGPSAKMPRSAGHQILEAIRYLEYFDDCGVLVFGGTLIKKIAKDSIAPIDFRKEYVTGKGIVLRNIAEKASEGLFVPAAAYDLVGSDEEKVAAAYRISEGYYVAEMPFVRINHYENQKSSRNKNGKIPGKDKYHWNTDEIKDANNFGFLRENYNPDYTSKGNVVSLEKYKEAGGQEFWTEPAKRTMFFDATTTEDLVKLILLNSK